MRCFLPSLVVNSTPVPALRKQAFIWLFARTPYPPNSFSGIYVCSGRTELDK